MRLPWFAFKNHELTVTDGESNSGGGDPNSSTADDNTGPAVVPKTTEADKAAKAKNLNDSIKDALEAAGKLHAPKEKDEPEVKVTPAPKAKSDESKGKKEKDDDELTPEELKAFKDLKGLLNNPDTATETIKLLAKKAGVKLDEVETKKEVAVAKKTILEKMKAKLPDDFQFLADLLAPSIEEAIKDGVEEEVKDLKEYKTRSEVKEIENEISNAVTGAFKLFTNSNEVEKEVFALMDEIPRGKDVSHAKYFERLIKLAADEKGLVLTKAGTDTKTKIDNDKIERNRNDAASRLASERGAEVKLGTAPPKKMSLDDAVKDAVAQATKNFNT